MTLTKCLKTLYAHTYTDFQFQFQHIKSSEVIPSILTIRKSKNKLQIADPSEIWGHRGNPENWRDSSAGRESPADSPPWGQKPLEKPEP